MSPAATVTEAIAACVVAVVLVAPKVHRRDTEQTFLTFPEWYLVHSPAEYAVYVKDHTPTQFPLLRAHSPVLARLLRGI
jgi:hypothetical protein